MDGVQRQRECVYLWEHVCFKVFAIWVHMLRAGTKGQEKEVTAEATQNNEWKEKQQEGEKDK